jgi:hypothetical protein
MRWALALVAVVAVSAVSAVAACSHQTAPRPRVDIVVPGPGDWDQITITAGARTAPLGRDLWPRVAPLHAARSLARPASLAEYGLDQPQARLDYHGASGKSAQVLVGSANFDHHFVYAKRSDGQAVYLLAADSFRPVLSLVGIDLPPPD